MEVLCVPDLLPTTRYPNDHAGDRDFERTPAEQGRLEHWLGTAEVLLGVPEETPGELPEVVRSCPDLRWAQGTGACVYAPYGPYFALIPEFLPQNVAGAGTDQQCRSRRRVRGGLRRRVAAGRGR